jgi:hypothetical protein
MLRRNTNGPAMPLSPPSERKLLHKRQILCQGYERPDGRWDIEGHLVDIKTYAWQNDYRGNVEAGEPIHEMWLRLTIDEDFLIHAAEASSDHHPFALCPSVVPNFAVLKGLKIGPGWRRAVRERVGGVKGCTHMVELLWPMASTAYQTIYSARERRARDEAESTGEKPELLDTCRALASDSEVVKRYWPAYYTGR